jgi:predicted DNA-binding antitoxin AbrB/MazE fold protein
MSQTIDAVIDENGAVRLLKPVHLSGARRALVTILDDQPAGNGDFDAGYREMAQDEARELEALEVSEATIGDVSDETR